MESGGESSELLRPGDVGEVVARGAFFPVGALILVHNDTKDLNSQFYWADHFLGTVVNKPITTTSVKLFWRPSAPDAL